MEGDDGRFVSSNQEKVTKAVEQSGNKKPKMRTRTGNRACNIKLLSFLVVKRPSGGRDLLVEHRDIYRIEITEPYLEK